MVSRGLDEPGGRHRFQHDHGSAPPVRCQQRLDDVAAGAVTRSALDDDIDHGGSTFVCCLPRNEDSDRKIAAATRGFGGLDAPGLGLSGVFDPSGGNWPFCLQAHLIATRRPRPRLLPNQLIAGVLLAGLQFGLPAIGKAGHFVLRHADSTATQ